MTNANDPINVSDHVNNDGTIQRHEYKGLTKREYFAAMALQGLLSRANPSIATTYTEQAVGMADQLINVLNK
jgi:hypothetical protein